MVEYIAVAVAVISAIGAITGAIVTGRANKDTVREEKTLPPYEALAERVGRLEIAYGNERARSQTLEDQAEERADRVTELERRAKCTEDKLDEIQAELDQDREWIRQTVAVAEQRGALGFIPPLPSWFDPDSESQRKRRQEP